MVSGAVASAKHAALEVGDDVSSAKGVTVAEVRAPDAGWVVVRSSTPPGHVLGRTPVPEGVSKDVLVKLTAADAAGVRVALHVDRGATGVFEFDPDNLERSPDKPVVVDRSFLEQSVALTRFGSDVVPNAALIKVEDQKVRSDSLTVDYLLLPSAAWISVNEIEKGVPGRLLGLVSRGAGELQEVVVPVKVPPDVREAVVTVHADRGTPGVFEYDPSDPLGSLDQPYKSAGVIVSKRIVLE